MISNKSTDFGFEGIFFDFSKKKNDITIIIFEITVGREGTEVYE